MIVPTPGEDSNIIDQGRPSQGRQSMSRHSF